MLWSSNSDHNFQSPQQEVSLIHKLAVAPAQSTGAAQRSFLLRVSLSTDEIWVEVVASSIDELLNSLQRSLRRHHDLQHLSILYITCVQSNPSLSSIGHDNSGVAAPSLASFTLCPTTQREGAIQVLCRKGKPMASVILLHDLADEAVIRKCCEQVGTLHSHHNVAPKAIFAIPLTMSCVIRSIPRRLSYLLICVRTVEERNATSDLASAAKSTNGDQAPYVFRAPSPHHTSLYDQYGLMQAQGVANEVTSLADLMSGVVRLIAPAMISEDVVRQGSFRMYFHNPHDNPAAFFKQLTHIGQVAVDTVLLCDATVGMAAPAGHSLQRSSTQSELQVARSIPTDGRQASPTPRDVLNAIRNRREFASKGVTAPIEHAELRTKELHVTATQDQRGHSHSPTRQRVVEEPSSQMSLFSDNFATATPVRTLNYSNYDVGLSNHTSVSVFGNSRVAFSPPPPPLQHREARLSEGERSPPLLFSNHHLYRMGVTSRDGTVPLKREEELEHETRASAAAFLAWQPPQLGSGGGLGTEASLMSSDATIRDVMVESFNRFPVDYRTDAPRELSDRFYSHRMITPSMDPGTSSIGGERAVIHVAGSPSEERRLLIQIALHLFLQHPLKDLFTTHQLTTFTPNVVQYFQRHYPIGVPIRFPLSKADSTEMARIIDEQIKFEIASGGVDPDVVEKYRKAMEKTEFAQLELAAPVLRSPFQRNNYDGTRFGGGRSPTRIGPQFDEMEDDDNDGYFGRLARDAPPMVDRLPLVPQAPEKILILTTPHFDPSTKRLLVYATIGTDIFDGASAALTQATNPFYNPEQDVQVRRDAGAVGIPDARRYAQMPFRWFLRTGRTQFLHVSKELPIDVFFALGIAKTFVLSHTVPITISLELDLDPQRDFDYISEGKERTLVHRWRSGGVSSILQEGVHYVVGVEIRRKDVPAEVKGVRGEVVQAVQTFVIPVGSGTVPLTRPQLYDMLVT